MKKINEIDFKDKNVIIRVDFNVPIENGIIKDNYRIKASLPTIKYCLKNGAAVILMSHLGRPRGKYDESLSLEPVFFELEDLLDNEIFFSNDCISNESINFSNELMQGEIHLLENLRFHKGEENNNNEFAKKLSEHGDIFINDAFGLAHRTHASNYGITNFIDKSIPGMLMNKEVDYLKNKINNPPDPFIVILGGSKIEDKIEFIDKMIEKSEKLIIGGKMAFCFLYALGKNVGSIKFSSKTIKLAKEMLNKAKIMGKDIILPIDFIAETNTIKDKNWEVVSLDRLTENYIGKDIGPESCFIFEEEIKLAKMILWNGPMGVFEEPQFSTGTHSIASSVLNSTKSNCITIIGGGDTASSVNSINIKHNFNHISTGGGAALRLMAGKKMPVIEALMA